MDELVFGLNWSAAEVEGMTLDQVRFWYDRAYRRQNKFKPL